MKAYFVTDLHGSISRYKSLRKLLLKDPPDVLLIGGDLLPHHCMRVQDGVKVPWDFVGEYLFEFFGKIRSSLGERYPAVLMILGNDDPKMEEETVRDLEEEGLWIYLDEKQVTVDGTSFFGYSYVPPTPFHLKDWEKYDVSRYVDPGSVSPEEGTRTVPVEKHLVRYQTIQNDLEKMTENLDLQGSVFLFHSPPHDTSLDVIAVEGKMIDHAPLDPHVGSIAIKRFIMAKQPSLTLHGHIHESTRLTGEWKEKIGRTICINGAHDGKELALVKIDLSHPEAAERILLN